MESIYNMRHITILLFVLTYIGLNSCKKESFELGKAPTETEAKFTYALSGNSDNIIVFTADNENVISVWDFGNDTKSGGSTATGTYPNKGTYTVTHTIYAKGGSASVSEDIIIVEDDLSLLSSPIFDFLTGGIVGGGSKTWVIDSNLASHFGVGPNPIGAAGNYPEYYPAQPNDKAGAGMYDDRYTFNLDAFKFGMITNGDVFVSSQEAGNFSNTIPGPGGDDNIAEFDNRTDDSWLISTESDTTLTITGESFIGFYTGIRTYNIITIGENELFLSYTDANASDLRWYLRLVPEGYDSGGSTGGGGGGDTNTTDTTVGYELPINFETDSVEFTAFGNSTANIVVNPDAAGINPSGRVLETEHGNETWAGLFVDLKQKLDFTSSNSIELKVWAPSAGVFRIKLENQDDDGEFVEKDFTVSSANEWVQVSIDFSDASPGIYNRLVVFPGWDVANAGTFYLDDFEQN
jgi:hypothetical protein